MGHYSWYEGYDGEYEYDVTVSENCIHWELEFDIQWSDPPREAIQSFEDFLANGTPSGFSSRFNEEIEKEVKKLMKAKDYTPWVPPSVDREVTSEEITSGDMKTSWERTEGSASHTIQITPEEIVFATSYPNPHAGGGGTSCLYEEFLAGEHHQLVRDLFGEKTLQEVIYSVKKAGDDPQLTARRKETDERKNFLRALPEDKRILKYLKDPRLENGFQYYGNAGGYNTEYKTGAYRFSKGAEESYIEERATGKKHRFEIPGYAVSVVAVKDTFYLAAWDNFWVVNCRGEILYTTYELTDRKNEKLFGAELRIDRTYRLGKKILVSLWWIGIPLPKSCLLFDTKKLTFTARCDLD